MNSILRRTIRRFRLVTALSTLLVFAPMAKGGLVFGILPSTQAANNVFYTFEDRPADAFFTLSGRVEANDISGPRTILTPDGFWKLTVSIVLNETFDDELSVFVTLQHLFQPHPGDDGGVGTPFGDSYSLSADTLANGVTSLSHAPASKPHGKHKDIFSGSSLTITKSAGTFGNDEIDKWIYTLDARHVPEPPGPALVAFSLLACAAMRLKSRRRPR